MIPAANSYTTVIAAGGYQLTGFQFTVTARADGSLPALENEQTKVSIGNDHLFRRGADSQYRVFCHPFPQDSRCRVLLPAGQYILRAPGLSNPNSVRFTPALNGRWLTLGEQSAHWQVAIATGSYATVPDIHGGNFSGFKFSVARRQDGALPVLTGITNAKLLDFPFSTLNSGGFIYRRVTTTAYAPYVNLSTSGLRPFGHAMLVPGDYIIEGQVAGSAPNPGMFRDAVLATGYWAAER
jgi:hypothetical protein